MRGNIYTLASLFLIILLFAGCQKENNLQPNTTELIKWDLDSDVMELVEIQASDRSVTTRNPNSIVTANYLTTGNHRIIMKAIQNPSGMHGTGTIEGPIYIDIRFNSACVNEIGNRATVGGEITFVELGDNPFNFPIQPGWFLYLAVEDNGNGKNGPKDRYHGEVYFSPPASGPLCAFLPPDNEFLWIPDDWQNVQGKNDKIIVK